MQKSFVINLVLNFELSGFYAVKLCHTFFLHPEKQDVIENNMKFHMTVEAKERYLDKHEKNNEVIQFHKNKKQRGVQDQPV